MPVASRRQRLRRTHPQCLLWPTGNDGGYQGTSRLRSVTLNYRDVAAQSTRSQKRLDEVEDTYFLSRLRHNVK